MRLTDAYRGFEPCGRVWGIDFKSEKYKTDALLLKTPAKEISLRGAYPVNQVNTIIEVYTYENE